MLANNSFKKVAIKAAGAGIRNSQDWKKAFLSYENGKLILLTHIQTINDPTLAGVAMHGMRCASWIPFVVLPDSLDEIIEAAISNRNYGTTIITISHDPETIAGVHSSSTGRARNNTAATRPAATAGSTDRNAAPAVSSDGLQLANYEGRQYSGFSGYHASHRQTMNAPRTSYSGYRVGVELEVEFNDDATRQQFTDQGRNWFFCESDGSLSRYGCEIITIPLLPWDAKSRATWKPIASQLKSLGASSWDNNRCGLHVHIGREILGDTPAQRDATLARLILFYNMYLNDDATALKVFGRSRCYNERDHKDSQELRAVNTLGHEVLKVKEVAERIGKTLKERNDCARYYTINTTNAATIEFRKGRGSLSVDRIQAIITFCESVCLYVRTSEDFSALTLEGFKNWIRENVAVNNSLYRYYEIMEEDC